VALITGEERRVPASPRYYVCTVEAMPLAVTVDFLAIDEIQLAAHPQRGHVFTDRLLNARGRLETWLLGADTMEPLLRELLPQVEVRRFPRLSQLTYGGVSSVHNLTPRCAAVAFSIPSVQRLAERFKPKGGCAVVLGALSPRTRNAQVAMYQAGEVPYLVGTDALGMGLNLDIRQVAFAELRKFDGDYDRPLKDAELGQIAGRAGRYHHNGTFSVLSPLGDLPPRCVRALQTHRFGRVEQLFWRNHEVDVSTPADLLQSLRRQPPHPALRLVARADDTEALARVIREPAVSSLAVGPERVKLLWDVCQLPDYRQLLPEAHSQLVGEIFGQLLKGTGYLDDAWLQPQVARLDDASGDVDALMARLAFIRTWSYVANRSHWVRDALQLRLRASQIEDRLSDARHQALVARYATGCRVVRHKLEQRRPASAGAGPFAALMTLRAELLGLPQRRDATSFAEEVADAPHGAFTLGRGGVVMVAGVPVARLTPGADALRPDVALCLDPPPPAGLRQRLLRRLLALVRDLATDCLGPSYQGGSAAGSSAVRAVMYHLEQGMGVVARVELEETLSSLTEGEHEQLVGLGVQIGARFVVLPEALQAERIERRVVLLQVIGTHLKSPPHPSAVSWRIPNGQATGDYLKLGFVPLGPRAVRVDVVERVLHRLQMAARAGTGEPAEATSSQLPSWLGCTRAELPAVMAALHLQQHPRPHRPGRRAAASGSPPQPRAETLGPNEQS
jgi:ATP-dependent RNA helicase SUPV3L1/SUV3